MNPFPQPEPESRMPRRAIRPADNPSPLELRAGESTMTVGFVLFLLALVVVLPVLMAVGLTRAGRDRASVEPITVPGALIVVPACPPAPGVGEGAAEGEGGGESSAAPQRKPAAQVLFHVRRFSDFFLEGRDHG